MITFTPHRRSVEKMLTPIGPAAVYHDSSAGFALHRRAVR